MSVRWSVHSTTASDILCACIKTRNKSFCPVAFRYGKFSSYNGEGGVPRHFVCEPRHFCFGRRHFCKLLFMEMLTLIATYTPLHIYTSIHTTIQMYCYNNYRSSAFSRPSQANKFSIHIHICTYL